jgi:hypothetical protein
MKTNIFFLCFIVIGSSIFAQKAHLSANKDNSLLSEKLMMTTQEKRQFSLLNFPVAQNLTAKTNENSFIDLVQVFESIKLPSAIKNEPSGNNRRFINDKEQEQNRFITPELIGNRSNLIQFKINRMANDESFFSFIKMISSSDFK